MTLQLGFTHHTFTVIARCPETRRLGLAMATSALAAGTHVPYIRGGLAAVGVQAHTDPRLGFLALRLLSLGYTSSKVLAELGTVDPYWEYRQVGIVDKEGEVVAYTGTKTLEWAGHRLGDGVITMGNFLCGPQVVDSMMQAYTTHPDKELADRLVGCLEAAREAGGEADRPEIDRQAARSASVHIYDTEEYPMIDLRVDVAHREAIAELRRCLEYYKPLVDYYYLIRSRDPAHMAPPAVWDREHPPILSAETEGIALPSPMTTS